MGTIGNVGASREQWRTQAGTGSTTRELACGGTLERDGERCQNGERDWERSMGTVPQGTLSRPQGTYGNWITAGNVLRGMTTKKHCWNELNLWE